MDSAEQLQHERRKQDKDFLATIVQMNTDAIALLDYPSGNGKPSAVPDAPSAWAGTLGVSDALRTPLETLAQHVQSDPERFGVDPKNVWRIQEAQTRLDHDDSDPLKRDSLRHDPR